MLLHHSKLSSPAPYLTFDWILALPYIHKSENLVKYTRKESLRGKKKKKREHEALLGAIRTLH